MRPSFDPGPTAARIWREVGYRPDFPRDLVQPIMETFDLAIVLIPRLSIASIAQWLIEHGRAPLRFPGDRRLSGCLLAQRGHGLAFLDGGSDANERRFALAHEFAHFYAHYFEPRRKALARFGSGIQPVLDGERPPTVDERPSEILRQTPLGGYEDYLSRDDSGLPNDRTLAIENEADLLALELLAPRGEIAARFGPAPDASVMTDRFGLPLRVSRLWADFMARQSPRQDAFICNLERAVEKMR